jgi:AbrB family looped-hinge helix DNA binding protein
VNSIAARRDFSAGVSAVKKVFDSALRLADNQIIGNSEMPMTKHYRLKLMAKGQMTVPASMRADLRMKQGDELELLLEGDRIVGAQVLTPLPAEIFTPELLADLENRVRRFGAAGTLESGVDGIRTRVLQQAEREVNARKTHSPVR